MELNRTGHSHSGQSSCYEKREEKSTSSTWNDHHVKQMSAPQTSEAGIGTLVLWLLKTAGEAVVYFVVNLVIDSQGSDGD